MAVAPGQYDTVGQLRADLQRGAIRDYRGYIAVAKVNGDSVGDQRPRGISGDLSYTVVLTDSHAGIDQASLTDLVPSSRVANNLRVIGPKRLTPCTITVVELSVGNQIHFHPDVMEQPDVFDCDDNEVLEVRA